MLSALIVLSAATPITLDTGVVTSAEAIQLVSQAMGRKLTVAGGVKHDNLFIKVDRMNPQRLLDELAKVTEAKWIEKDDFLILTAPEPSPKDEWKYRRVMVDAWLKNLKVRPRLTKADARRLADKAAEVRTALEQGESDQNSQRILNRESPHGRAHRRLLLTLPSTALSDLSPGDRVVYSLTPTKIQRPLPPSAAGILKEMMEEAEILRRAFDLQPSESRIEDPLTSLYRHPWGDVKSALLVITHDDVCAASELKLVENTDWFGLHDQLRVDGYGDKPYPAFQGGSHRGVEGVEGDLDLTAEEAELGIALRTGRSVPTGPKVKPKSELLSRLFKLDSNDLLTVVPSKILRRLGESKKRDVLAVVSDVGLLSCAVSGVEGRKMPLSRAVSKLIASEMMSMPNKLEELDDLIFVRPSSLSRARLDRISWPDFAVFLRRAEEAGQMDLDVAADFARTTDRPLPLLFAQTMAAMVTGSTWSIPMAGPQLELLRLYGLQTPAIREKIKSGGVALPAAGFTGEAKEILHRLTFGYQPSIHVRGADAVIKKESENYNLGIRQEPTIGLPQGIVGSAMVQLSLHAAPTLMGIDSQSPFEPPIPVNLDQLSHSIVDRERGRAGYRFCDQFATLQRKELKLKIQHAARVSSSRVLHHVETGRDANFISLKDMPLEFQKQLSDLVAMRRKEMKDWPTIPQKPKVKPPVL